MKRMFLVPAFGLAALVMSAPAHAQSGGWIDSSRPPYAIHERQGYVDSRRAAYDNGFREGRRLAERESRRRSAYSYRNDRTYRRADKGYHRSFGDIARYRQSFRAGFEAGYSEAYQRYGRSDRRREGWRPNAGYQDRYPRGGGYAHPAFESGISEGYEKGVEDARKRRSYDVLRHKWYREGDRHYERRYGARDQYKNIYRQGFKRGYDQGYREW